MHSVHFLTVAAGKRLIARGLLAHPHLRRARKHGTICILPGSTNAYVAEELIGAAFPKRAFVTGRTVPPGNADCQLGGRSNPLVVRDGEPEELALEKVLPALRAGDVLLKGANLINHAAGQSGVLIGHPTGGNLGAAFGTAVARRVRLIVPAGLEKDCSVDLHEAARGLQADLPGTGPALWVLGEPPFTELEALSVLCGVRATVVGAGGLGGAEGGTWLAVHGDNEQVGAAEHLINEVAAESPFCEE